MKNYRKILVCGIIVIFLGLVSYPSITAGITNNDFSSNHKYENEYNDLVLYRFGSEESIEKIGSLNDLEMKDLSLSQITDQCEELFGEDNEFQQLVDYNSANIIKVRSWGTGFHFALFLPMFRYLPRFHSQIIFRYIRNMNEDAYTSLNNVTFHGPQKGSIIGFLGFGVFSTRIFGKMAIYGYALMRVDIKLLE